MATKIVTKNSSTSGSAPLASDLVQGELAVNVTDKRLYTENASGTIVEVGTNPSTIDINSGTIDGTTIGASSASTGAFTTLTASGEITANGGIALGDNDKATFGAGDDLQIFHDGSHSQIKDAGTGNLYIKATSGVLIQDNDTGTNRITTSAAGPVYVYHAGDQKLATTATGIDVTGTATMDVLDASGTGVHDLQRSHSTTTGSLAVLDLKAKSTGDMVAGFGAAARFIIEDTANVENVVAEIAARRESSDSTAALTFTTLVKERMRIASNGDVSFYEDTGTTPKFSWSSANETISIGIGASSTATISAFSRTVSANLPSALRVIENTGASSYWDIGSTGGASNNLNFYANANTTPKVTFTGSGNVGIGESSPDQKLHVSQAINNGFATVKIENSFGSTTAIGTGSSLQFSGWDAGVTANIKSIRTGSSYSPSALTFETFGGAGTTGSNTLAERMRIDEFGFVGIGTSAPSTYGVDGAEDLVIGQADGNHGLTISSFGSSNGTIAFSDQTNVAVGRGYLDYDHSVNAMTVGTNGTERMRIDSSGNLLVGSSSTPSGSTDGTVIFASGTIAAYRTAAAPAVFSRNASNGGDVVVIQQQGTTVGSIGVINNNNLTVGGSVASHAGLQFGTENVTPMVAGVEADAGANLGATNLRWRDLYLSGTANIAGGKISSYAADTNAPYFADGGNVGIRFSQAGVDDVVPCSSAGADRDNGINFGSAGARWGTLFAATGTINTSDKNEKQDIAELSDAEQRVAVAAKGLLRKFRWKDSVAEKGDDARIHFGVMAQDLQAAFAAEGLDASDYAMWCSDTWVDKETNEEKTRLGIRYSELLAFIIAAL